MGCEGGESFVSIVPLNTVSRNFPVPLKRSCRLRGRAADSNVEQNELIADAVDGGVVAIFAVPE